MNHQALHHIDFSSLDPLLLIVLAALMAGLTVLVLAQRVHWRLPQRGAGSTVLAYLEQESSGDADSPVAAIHLHKDAIILDSLGLSYTPHLLAGLRLGCALLPAVLLALLSYPWVLVLGGGVLGAILAHTWLQGRWRRFCNQVEQELPTFTSRLSGTLLVTTSPVAALEDVVEGLSPGTPLRLWLQAFGRGLRLPGRQHFVAQAQQSAGDISMSLALVVFELGRLLETGGSGFTQAFTTTSEHLTSILRARAVARSKAEAARSSVLTMLAIMAVVILLMLSAEQNRAAYHDPLVQLVALGCLGAMALGYGLLNNMIDEALEG